MKALVQRVTEASVAIAGDVYSQIGQGYLVLLGVERDDSSLEADYLAKKIVNLILPAETGRDLKQPQNPKPLSLYTNI